MKKSNGGLFIVKYNHCEKCKRIFNTETWIGEVHTYNGICPSCMAGEQQENQMQKESIQDHVINKHNIEQTENVTDVHEIPQSSPIELEKTLFSRLEQMVNDVLSKEDSMDVLIKEFKIELLDKARERIEETFQSFDVRKIDAEMIVDYAEKKFNYLSEYKDYMDNVVKKLQDNPKMNGKTAIEKVFKEAMANMPKNCTKDVLLDKKAMLKKIFGKAEKWYNIYSDTKDLFEFGNNMVLHPFKKIQKKLSTLPFYTSIN